MENLSENSISEIKSELTDSVVKFSQMPMGKIRHIHFIGIGGSGMSGIAEVMLNLGYEISGSDLSSGRVTEYLQKCGIRITIGHKSSNIENADVVVKSTAIKDDNPEVVEARQRRIPVIPRAEMLAEIMRFRYGIAVAGTHGKTTTTSLVASILAQADMDPTFVIGGKLNSAGTHARLGDSPYLVAEADESDASFLHLQPMISIVTNLEEDHMDTYGGDFRKLEDTFIEFLHQLPFYGLAVLCFDDENVVNIEERVSRRIVSYGIENENVDIRAYDLVQNELKTSFQVKLKEEAESFSVTLNMPGRHNVLNALAAIAVANELGISIAVIQEALLNFQGIGRRFQVYGDLPCNDGGKVMMVDDYGHHPSELAVTIDAIRNGWPTRRLVVAFQPHRYTRTRDLFDSFVHVLNQVDQLLLLEVYPAGEQVIPGADSRSLCRSIRNLGQLDPILVQNYDDLPGLINNLLRDDDILLTMGAGTIGGLATTLHQALLELNQVDG